MSMLGRGFSGVRAPHFRGTPPARSRSHPSTSRMWRIERLGFPRGRLGESSVLMWLLFLRLLRSTIVLAILRRVWRNRRRIVAAARR